MTFSKTFIRLILFGSLCAAAAGDEAEPRNGNDLHMAVRPIYAVTEFFDTRLPGTLDKFDLTLEYRPRFSDFIRREFIRFPLVLRYGLTEDLEIGALTTPVVPHPFKSGEGRKWGPGEFGILARTNITPVLGLWDWATIEVTIRQPLGRPPVELIDGHTRVQPVLAVSRAVIDPETTILFANVSYDYALGHWGRSKPDPAKITRQDIAEAGPGVLFKPNELGYFVEYRLRHTDEPEENRWAHVYRIGLVWEVPRHRSERVRLPGHWQVEAGYRLTDEQSRSLSHALTLRVRWRGDLKAFFRGEPAQAAVEEEENNLNQFLPR